MNSKSNSKHVSSISPAAGLGAAVGMKGQLSALGAVVGQAAGASAGDFQSFATSGAVGRVSDRRLPSFVARLPLTARLRSTLCSIAFSVDKAKMPPDIPGGRLDLRERQRGAVEAPEASISYPLLSNKAIDDNDADGHDGSLTPFPPTPPTTPTTTAVADHVSSASTAAAATSMSMSAPNHLSLPAPASVDDGTIALSAAAIVERILASQAPMTPPETPEADHAPLPAFRLEGPPSALATGFAKEIFPRDTGVGERTDAHVVICADGTVVVDGHVVGVEAMEHQWEGVMIESSVSGFGADGSRSFYVKPRPPALEDLRGSVVNLLDVADEQLHCDNVVICLDKSHPDLAQLIHSLLYVGGHVVTTSAFVHAPHLLLVALEL